MNIVLDIISVLAFLMSSIIWIINIYQRCVNIEFKVLDFDKRENGVLFFVSVINKADNSCSISSIQIMHKGNWITCELLPMSVHSFKGQKYYSAQMPVNLPPRGGQSFYIFFQGMSDAPLNPGYMADYQIHTNRNPILKTETLPEQGHYCTNPQWFAE